MSVRARVCVGVCVRARVCVCARARHIGSNLEHANTFELGLEAGSVNHMFVGLQTEEAPIALYLHYSTCVPYPMCQQVFPVFWPAMI